MNEHPPAQELEQYWQRTLAPANFWLFIDIITCTSCAERCPPLQLTHDYEELLSAFVPQHDAKPYHLSAAEVAAYRRHELGEIDLEIVESHLITCNRCRDETKKSAPRFQSWRIAAAVLVGVVLILLALFMIRSRRQTQPQRAVTPVPENSQPDFANSSPQRGTNSEAPSVADNKPVVSLSDEGQQITLNSKGELEGLEGLSPNLRQTVKATLQAGRVGPPLVIGQLTGKPSTLLSPPDNGVSFRLVSPPAVVVQSVRPTFHWEPLADAKPQSASLMRAERSATSPALASIEWRITTPLKPGAVYSQATALKEGPIISPVLPAAQARFSGGP